MSTRDARRFITDLENDPSMVAKLADLGPAFEDEAMSAYYARFADQLGYSFTSEEYAAGLMQVRAARKGVIMEEELTDLL